MIAWWNELETVQQVFALIAIPSTLVLLIQTVMLLIGFGESDTDVDGDEVFEAGAEGDGFILFSVRGIVAMLCIGSWSGIVLGDTALHGAVVIILSIIIGFAALIGMAMLIKLILKLQSSGNIQMSNAIGKVGQVYLTIPANGAGSGKITIVIQEKFTEAQAITRDEQDIKTGEVVRVVGTDDLGLFVVERVIK